MPLDENGWSVHLHNDLCPKPCVDGSRCAGTVARIIQKSRTEGIDHTQAVSGISEIVEEMLGSPGVTLGKFSGIEIPGLSSYGIVRVPISSIYEERGDQNETLDPFDIAFDVLTRVIDALRIATNASIPPLTIERIYPIYIELDCDEDGKVEVKNIAISEHGSLLERSDAATPAQLRSAEEYFVAGANDDPVENIRYWMLAARNDARVIGDYAGAALKTAAASEILIKTTAGLLIWEQIEHQPQLRSSWSSKGQAALSMRPSELIASVLSPALRGGWSSQHNHQPVGAWRLYVAKLRNRVIHNGYRPSAPEVHDAICAVDQLVDHVADRIASRAQLHPRTAVILLGQEGLERRGAWGKVRATLDADGSDWRDQYRTWSEGLADVLSDE